MKICFFLFSGMIEISNSVEPISCWVLDIAFATDKFNGKVR